MNNDNFHSQKMYGCLYAVAIELSHTIFPTPDVDELVSMGWMRCGRHYKGGDEGQMSFKVIRYNMIKAYFRKAKGNGSNCGIVKSDIPLRRRMVHDNFGEYDTGQLEFDAKEDLQYYLNKLSPRNRRIVEMCYLEGRTFESIGEELGRTRQAIKQALDRSIKKMSPKEK